MFDGEAQSAGTGGTDHEPCAAFGKILFVEMLRELLVIVPVIFPADALLRHTRCAARLEDIIGASGITFGNPPLVLFIAEPFVLKVREFLQVRQRVNFGEGVPARAPRPIEPERTAGFR